MSNRNIRKGNKAKKTSININFKRQKKIFDPQIFQESITIVGLGNIGSQTCIALSRLGLKDFYIYDYDKVEEHNLASQAYSLKQLGKEKAKSLKETMKGINKNISVSAFSEKFSGKVCLSNILVIAVDTMKERKRICKRLKKSKYKPKLIIDGRMGGSQLEIYTCQSLDEWEDTLFDNTSKDSCGARYICYISMVIGSLIANQIKRLIKGETYKKSILFNIDSLQLI